MTADASILESDNRAQTLKLSELRVGETARIVAVDGSGAILQRILELGLLPGKEVRLVRVAPLGDPIEIRVMGYNLSLRKSEAALIRVETA